MLTLHDFSGAVKFHELRQNASAFREKIHEYGKKKVRRNSGPYSLKIANLTTPLLLLLLPPRVTPPPIAFPPEYKPGQGIMPHTDGPFYAPRTATLSVGSDAVMHFSPRVAAADIGRPGVDARPLSSLVLKRRCLVVFADEAYSRLLHGIDAVTEETVGARGAPVVNAGAAGTPEGTVVRRQLRVSLTFRKVKGRPGGASDL